MFRRILAALLLIGVGVSALALGWPQILSLQRTAVIAQLVSFRGAASVAALGVLSVLLVLSITNRAFRRLGFSLMTVAAVFVLINVAVLSSRGFGGTTLPARAPADLTVLTWNTLGDAPGAAVIAGLAIESRADIITLPETTLETATAVAALMSSAGLPMASHTVAFGRISKARSTSVLISTALGGYHLDGSRGSTSTLPSLVMVPDDGAGSTIVAVHAVAPLPRDLARWNADLRWVAGSCRSGDVILAGDFNATLDHLSGLGLSAGTTVGACTDAALRSRIGAVGTWPTAAPRCSARRSTT